MTISQLWATVSNWRGVLLIILGDRLGLGRGEGGGVNEGERKGGTERDDS